MSTLDTGGGSGGGSLGQGADGILDQVVQPGNGWTAHWGGGNSIRAPLGVVFGGGAGAGSNGLNNTTGGLSLFGGNGGNGGRSITPDGIQPGGGGGGRNNALNGGNGAAGQVIVTVF
jgi:hypothetical protein